MIPSPAVRFGLNRHELQGGITLYDGLTNRHYPITGILPDNEITHKLRAAHGPYGDPVRVQLGKTSRTGQPVIRHYVFDHGRISNLHVVG